MLENDGMILTEILGKGNRRKHLLTVVNWQKYQKTSTEDYTETVPKIIPKQYPNVPPNNNDLIRKNNLYAESRKFYKTELETSSNNPLFDQFIKILFGESGAGIRCDGILKMEQQVTWAQFQILVDKAKAKGVKISDLIYDFENGGYFKGKKSLFLSLNNWINKR